MATNDAHTREVSSLERLVKNFKEVKSMITDIDVNVQTLIDSTSAIYDAVQCRCVSSEYGLNYLTDPDIE